MLDYKLIEEILPLLRCVECGASALQITSNDKTQWTEYAFDTGEVSLCCNQCNTCYPVTDDGIPVLWTSQMKEMLRAKPDSTDGPHEFREERAALHSNISSYERISDDYAVNWRRDDALVQRMKAGAVRLCSPVSKNSSSGRSRYHLDVGCGPGHVLEWLGDIGYRQIGLDVSLTNLRNARKSTGALVVLGDGTAMPFNNSVFHLVTGSAVLHHIFDWKKVVHESCRVCEKNEGGIMYDSEPTVESLALGPVARLVFDMRWLAYKLLSYIDNRKIHFRNTSLAKEYYMTAEVHNQPGKGFSISDVRGSFESSGFTPDIFLSPNDQLQFREIIPIKESGWKRIVLHLLSGHNPLRARYGSFTVLAVPKG